ncbi:MAG: DUF433 domain-containing protein [Acidobacteriia bacterium]|nr:DUF433 domain-containing protein [Terriglobia bacterium]
MQYDARRLMETPIYGAAEVARYVRVPYQTLRYWIRENPLIELASLSPLRLSFMNLMECHMLSSMRSTYRISIPKVRASLATLARIHPHPHPLVDQPFETDQVDLFIRELGDEVINLCRSGQLALKEIIGVHLKRIEVDATGMYRFFPFIEERTAREPRSIMISPVISFGKPVISGTGISTAVIASRFHARESVDALAEEYGRPPREIEEAIRWESAATAA